MTTIETLTTTVGSETRVADLRLDVHSNGKRFLSVWYQGDETGIFKKQYEAAESRTRDMWEKFVATTGGKREVM